MEIIRLIKVIPDEITYDEKFFGMATIAACGIALKIIGSLGILLSEPALLLGYVALSYLFFRVNHVKVKEDVKKILVKKVQT